MKYAICSLWLGFFLLSVSGFAFAEETEEYPYVGEVAAGQLVVRGGPSTNFKELGLLTKGDKVLVFEKKGDFLRIRCPKNAKCYVSKKYVATEDGIAGRVIGDRLIVRESANPKGSPMHGGILEKGTVVRIIRPTADWYQIAPPKGLCAWVGTKHVTRLGSWAELQGKYPELGEREIADVEKEPSDMGERPGEATAAAPKDEHQAKFDEGEAIFQQELEDSPENMDFTKALELFKEVEMNAKDESLKMRAKYRVDAIVPLQILVEMYKLKVGEGVNIKKEYEDKIRAEREKFLAELESQRKEPEYVARGYVDGVGFLLNIPADIRYKLVMGGKVLYFLKSASVNLKKYYNKYVGVVGSIAEVTEGDLPYRLIEVERVDILGETE